MAVEQVTELQVLAEHVEGFVATEALELGGVDAAIHASGQGAALEAVAGQVAPGKAGGDGARLDDVGDRARRERCFANLGQGRGGVFGGLSGVWGVRPASPTVRSSGESGSRPPKVQQPVAQAPDPRLPVARRSSNSRWTIALRSGGLRGKRPAAHR